MRYGSQSPTFHTVGDYEYSLSNIAMELFDAWGIGFYPSQEYELELFLARDANDGTACRTICISKPRQNGKSYAARFYAIWCACVEGKQVLYTAHHGDTVNEMFEILENLCGDIKDLRANLRSIYRGKGHQCIKFTNGGRIDFRTRTAAGGRGRTYDVVIYDEAQELNDAQLSAIKATIIASESGDPQSIYLGTPPDPECTGTVFRGFHKQVHAGDSEGIWWLEWSVDGIPDMSDVDTVMELAYETNPALGYRIKEDVMRDTIITSKNDPDSFAREFLGFWSKEVIVKGVLNKHDWGACSTTDPPKTGKLVYAVKFSVNGSRASLAVCIKPKEGIPHVEIIDSASLRHGITPLVEWLTKRKDEIALVLIDGKAYSETLKEKLIDAGFPKKAVETLQPEAVTKSAAMMKDCVTNKTVTHFNQPGLNESATKSTKRMIGNKGGWGFAPNNCDETVIESAAMALYGATTTKRKAKSERTNRIG